MAGRDLFNPIFFNDSDSDTVRSDDYTAFNIPLPAAVDYPFSPRHGNIAVDPLKNGIDQAEEDFFVDYEWAAQYPREILPVAVIEVSTREAAISGQSSGNNPRGWTGPGRQIETVGWSSLEPYIDQLASLGFKHIWIKGWSGWHSNASSITDEAYIVPNTAIYGSNFLQQWEALASNFESQGIKLMAWIGDVSRPNTGSRGNPSFAWYRGRTAYTLPEEHDEDYIIDTIKFARDRGFSGVILGGVTKILDNLDDSELVSQDPVDGAPDRQIGITKSLLENIREDSDIGYDWFVASADMLPYGEHLALTPTVFEMQSQATSGTDRYDATTLVLPAIEYFANVGCEINGRIQGDGWTLSDYNAARTAMDGFGIRNVVDWTVLESLGLVQFFESSLGGIVQPGLRDNRGTDVNQFQVTYRPNETYFAFDTTTLGHTTTIWEFRPDITGQTRATIRVTTNSNGLVSPRNAGFIVSAGKNSISIVLNRKNNWYVRVKENDSNFSDWQFIDMSGQIRVLGGRHRDRYSSSIQDGKLTFSNNNPEFTQRRINGRLVTTRNFYPSGQSRRTDYGDGRN